MSEFIDTLQELVNSICDNLFADRQLITNQAVKKIVLLHQNWMAETTELDQKLPSYINVWRINNLQADGDLSSDSLSSLTAQLCKYKADMYNAQQTINQLKGELVAKNNELKMLRKNIVRDLRGLLDA